MECLAVPLLLSTAMAGFSLVLVGLMLFTIKAFCVFCVLSATLCALANGGPGTPPPVQAESTPAKVDLAKHLSQIGATLYPAYWCPHCHDQKELFGKEAAAKLTIIECAPDGRNNQAALCKQKGVQGYPTWEIKGVINSGVKPLEQLAQLSHYKGSRQF